MPGGGTTPNFPDDDLRPSLAAPSPSNVAVASLNLVWERMILYIFSSIPAPFPFLPNRSWEFDRSRPSHMDPRSIYCTLYRAPPKT
jgi:hypothetical protein